MATFSNWQSYPPPTWLAACFMNASGGLSSIRGDGVSPRDGRHLYAPTTMHGRRLRALVVFRARGSYSGFALSHGRGHDLGLGRSSRCLGGGTDGNSRLDYCSDGATALPGYCGAAADGVDLLLHRRGLLLAGDCDTSHSDPDGSLCREHAPDAAGRAQSHSGWRPQQPPCLRDAASLTGIRASTRRGTWADCIKNKRNCDQYPETPQLSWLIQHTVYSCTHSLGLHVCTRQK